ncbi:MAG: peptidoglycan-binding protein [Armatimonadetes bacterium]|nr:peptidoglycan-binding protein [Armatimonadota bacterium]
MIVTASSALGADRDGNFRVKGFGLESCESYTAASAGSAPRHFAFRSWLNGYLTAYNQLAASTYGITGKANLESLTAWLAEYCQARPGVSFVLAVSALTAALEPNRLTEQPASTPKAALSEADRETVRRIQRVLKDKGYYTGTTDGLFGPGTRMGLEAFQRKEGLNVTGQPDVPTLDRLKLLR